MTFLRRILAMLFDTKSVRELRTERADLQTMVAAKKTEEAVAMVDLQQTFDQARVASKYRPSAMAGSMGWKSYG